MRLGALLIVAVSTMNVIPAGAAPTVDVRARTTVQLAKVELRNAGLAEVTGQLVDKLTGDGLGGQQVRVRLGDATATATTTPDGTFHLNIEATTGPQEVQLDFPGSPLLEASTLTMITDPSRAQVTLTVTVDEPARPGQSPTLTVHATSDEGAVRLPIDISAGAPTDKDLHMLRTVQTDAPFPISRADAGGPGTRRVRAAFAGDDLHQPASAEVTLELVDASTTTIELSSTSLAFEEDLEVDGVVTDGDGAPVARAAVYLVAGDRRLASGATGADGRYHFEIEADVIAQEGQPGQFALQTQADPGSTSMRPSRSEPVIIKIAAPQPVPVSYTLAAFAATLFAAAGFFLARSKPWRRIRRPAPAAEANPAAAPDGAESAGGLVVNRPGVMSTLRRPNDDGFAGVVRDTVRGRPVTEAVVRVVLAGVEREVRTGGDGAFAIEGLPAGEWQAEVAAPGHVTTRFALSIPHRGELRGARIDLVPVRERVFQLYRRAAEPALPDARLWGIWSPRQIVDHVRARQPSPAMADLTDFVEEVYFSPRLAAEAMLSTASDRVERAIREARPRV